MTSFVPLFFLKLRLLSYTLTDWSSFVSSLPACARPHLEWELDWGHEGVDKDLSEIAHHMLDWEERLATHLELTAVDIHDIRSKHRDSAPLQR